MSDRGVALRVERSSGSAADFHGRALPDEPGLGLWVFDVATPAIALGSRQGIETVDAAECARQGVEVVRRRSGGGAVLLLPGEVEWIDVLVPAGHVLWSDDVRESMVRIGERWADALATLVDDDLRVHRDGLVRTPWSDLVCFAGAGPGEVFVGERKLVGISQRRTRGVARFQCAVHRRYDARRTVALLAGPHPPGPAPDAVAVLAPHVSSARLADTLAAALTA